LAQARSIRLLNAFTRSIGGPSTIVRWWCSRPPLRSGTATVAAVRNRSARMLSCAWRASAVHGSSGTRCETSKRRSIAAQACAFGRALSSPSFRRPRSGAKVFAKSSTGELSVAADLTEQRIGELLGHRALSQEPEVVRVGGWPEAPRDFR